MRTIDVTRKFSVSTDVSVYAPATPLPPQVPRTDGSVLWPTEDNTLDFMLGAQQARQKDIEDKIIPDEWFPNDQFRYNTQSGQWTKEKVGMSGWNEEMRNRAMILTRGGVWVPRKKMGFVVGGQWWSNSVYKVGAPEASFSLMIYDHQQRMWTNESLPHRQMENVPAVHLEAGDDDLIIALGGEIPGAKRQEEFRLVSC